MALGSQLPLPFAPGGATGGIPYAPTGGVDVSAYFPQTMAAAGQGAPATFQPAPFQPAATPQPNALSQPFSGAATRATKPPRLPAGVAQAATANPLAPPAPTSAPIAGPTATPSLPPSLSRMGGGSGGGGIPTSSLPPPPAAPPATGMLAKAKNTGRSLAPAIAGTVLSGAGNYAQQQGFAGGRPVEVLGKGMQAGGLAGFIPGVAGIPAALTAGTGLMVGDTGGQIATSRLPGNIRAAEGKPTGQLLGQIVDPASMIELADRFGNWSGIDNFGNFKDKAMEGTRSLSDIPFENVPMVGGFLDGLLGDGGGGGEQSTVDAAAAAQQAAIPQNGEQFQQLMTRLPFSPETVDKTMKEYANTLTMNQIRAEQGQLFMPADDGELTLEDVGLTTDDGYAEDAKFALVPPEAADAYTAAQFNAAIGDLWMGEQQQQQQLLDAAAFQAANAEAFGGLMGQQQAIDAMFNGAMTNLNNSPLLAGLDPQYQMGGAASDYMAAMQLAQQQRILDMQYQGSQIPYVQARDELASMQAQFEAARQSQGIQAAAQQSLTDVPLVP